MVQEHCPYFVCTGERRGKIDSERWRRVCLWPIHGKQLARVRRVGRIEDGGTTQHNVLVVADRELGVWVGHVAAHVALAGADTVRESPTH